MNRRLLRIIAQLLYVGVLAFVVIGVVVTARKNLDKQGITTGFGFLWRSTGWDIGFSFIPTTISDPYWWILLMGLINTVTVGFAAMAIATVFGLGLAAMRISDNIVLNLFATTQIEIARNVPPLVQLFAWYAIFTSLPAPRNAVKITGGMMASARGLYLPSFNVSGWASLSAVLLILLMFAGFVLLAIGKRSWFLSFRRKILIAASLLAAACIAIASIFALSRIADAPLISHPELKGFNIRGGMSLPTELLTVFCSMVFFGSAFIAEVLRGGFRSVDRGQIEASKALGMTDWMIFSRVQVPIIVKNILPMMTNLFVWLIKATAAGIVIGFSDLFSLAINSINQSGQTLEFLFIVALAFWAINTGITSGMGRADRRLQSVGSSKSASKAAS